MRHFQRISLKMFSVLMLSAMMVVGAYAQNRLDNMTDKEDMQVREAQELDLRMKVYIKIVDRRILGLKDPSAGTSKEVQKSIDTWGELRVGNAVSMYSDIDKTIGEAVSRIDDAAERDMNNPLFGKAVHILADAAKRWLPDFNAFLQKASTERERALLGSAIEQSNQIVEASAKVAKETKKKKSP